MDQISILDALVALELSWWRLGKFEKVFGGVLGPSCAALGVQLGSQNGANLNKTSIKKSIIFWMPLGIDFWLDFGCQNGAKLAPKWDQTSISQKTRKNAFGTSPLVPNWVQGIQVGSKNQPKIDPNMESKMECILASIFDTFQWILGGKLGGKMDQKSIQKGIGKRIQKRNDFSIDFGKFWWGEPTGVPTARGDFPTP